MNLEKETWFRALALHLPEEVYHQVKDKCQEYIEAKCKEQIEICADKTIKGGYYRHAILNAKLATEE